MAEELDMEKFVSEIGFGADGLKARLDSLLGTIDINGISLKCLEWFIRSYSRWYNSLDKGLLVVDAEGSGLDKAVFDVIAYSAFVDLDYELGTKLKSKSPNDYLYDMVYFFVTKNIILLKCGKLQAGKFDEVYKKKFLSKYHN